MTSIENKIDNHKKELADKLAPLISKEGLTDVTDWISKNGGSIEGMDCTHNGVARSVAYILEATGDFEREELEDKSRYYVKRLPKRSLEQRQPTIFKLSLIFLGIGVTLLTNYITELTKQQPQTPIYKLEDYRMDALYDSVKIIRHDLQSLQDSLKNDTTQH